MFTKVSSAILLPFTLVVNGAQQSTFLTPHKKLSCSGIIRMSENERAIKSHEVACTLKYKSCFKLSISAISKAHIRINVTDTAKDSLR